METRKRHRRIRKRRATIFATSLLALIIIVASFSIFQIEKNTQENQRINKLSQNLGLLYKNSFPTKNVTNTKIIAFSTKLTDKKGKIPNKNYQLFKEKLSLLDLKVNKQNAINALFVSPVMLGKTLKTSTVKTSTTQKSIKAVVLSALPKDNFLTHAQKEINQAKKQVSARDKEQNLLQKILTAITQNPTNSNLLTAQNTINKLPVATKNKENQALVAAVQKFYAGKKLIALTFDDGPNATTTPTLLNTLEQDDVHATFFEIGSHIAGNEALLKRQTADGDQICSHTWTHPELTSLTAPAANLEITRAATLITQITGQNWPFYRPPYEAVNQTVLNSVNMSAVNYDVDTQDWEDSTSAPVYSAAMAGAHDGAIILMHDIHPWTVAAVPNIIASLKQQGYTFVTVSQLIYDKAGAIQLHHDYFGW
ncbi:polysaccharide deacetylase family protein [Lactococcus nasutitermitis]|uniref:Polysaccharide deacetylase family protein n=1 Tax=Lactococcus nasutitermitis TaxID=1652957 RepID=A0ABV9JF71_9LACT|nr:polysaccharide deacetylase family protein [Lactococcus nasutitermitis]